MLSLLLMLAAVFLLSITERDGLLPVLFEAFSAFGTVGLTTGITPSLSLAGKLIIVFTIFVGRLGPITLAAALVQRERPSSYHDPHEIIRLG